MSKFVIQCRVASKLDLCRKNDIWLKVDDIIEKVSDVCRKIDVISERLTIEHIGEIQVLLCRGARHRFFPIFFSNNTLIQQTSMEAHGGCFLE